MQTNEENTRYIPVKNYILVVLMFLAVILITLYLFKWYQVKSSEKTAQSYLVENKLVVNQTSSIDELKNVITENSSRLLLYISYRNSSKIYNIEKKYDHIFKDYNISDIFYLFDITDIKENNKNYKNYINNYLDINVSDYPVIIFYEDGQINSYKKIKSHKDLEKFIKKIDKNSL